MTKLISNQESIAPTSTSTIVATPVAMPRFVNMDGNMSVDENGNTYNNNDTEKNSMINNLLFVKSFIFIIFVVEK